MGKVINLNQYRKQKAKAAATKKAEANRRLHGRSKSERTSEDFRRRQLEKTVDGARLESAPTESRDDS